MNLSEDERSKLISPWTCLMPVSYFAWHEISISTAVWKVYSITTIHSTISRWPNPLDAHVSFTSISSQLKLLWFLCLFGGEKWFCIGWFLFFFYSPWWFFPPGFKDSRPPQFIAFTHLIVTQGFDLSICASSPSLWEKHRNHWQKSSEIDWKNNQTSTSCWRWCFCQLNTVEGIIQTCSITFYNLPGTSPCLVSLVDVVLPERVQPIILGLAQTSKKKSFQSPKHLEISHRLLQDIEKTHWKASTRCIHIL